MSDQKQVNEADLDWLAERDQPITDAIRAAEVESFGDPWGGPDSAGNEPVAEGGGVNGSEKI